MKVLKVPIDKYLVPQKQEEGVALKLKLKDSVLYVEQLTKHRL